MFQHHRYFFKIILIRDWCIIITDTYSFFFSFLERKKQYQFATDFQFSLPGCRWCSGSWAPRWSRSGQPRIHNSLQRGWTVFRVWEAHSNITHAQHLALLRRIIELRNSYRRLKTIQNHVGDNKMFKLYTISDILS